MPPKPVSKCQQCGGSKLEPGTLRGDGKVGFRPDHLAKFFSLTGEAAVQAIACVDCGYVQLHVDIEKLASLTGRD